MNNEFFENLYDIIPRREIRWHADNVVNPLDADIISIARDGNRILIERIPLRGWRIISVVPLHEIPNSMRRLNLPALTIITRKTKKEECAICIENYTNDDKICVNCCSHKFHFSCLAEWVKRNPSCPICRKAVQTS